MSEVSGIFPNMVGAIEEGATKTATEINAKTQGQITRLAMIVDTINQDLIIPNVEKVAKLCADFKSGVETIFVSKDNQQEYIEVDDSVRQGDYKYTYSDNTTSAVKSEQADLVVASVERFAQQIPLNLQEIFIWYFEQKGVDNPERFLMQGDAGGAEQSLFDPAQLANLAQAAKLQGAMQDVKAAAQTPNADKLPSNTEYLSKLMSIIRNRRKNRKAKQGEG